MAGRFLKVSASAVGPAALERARQALARHRLVICPTETSYALAGDARSEEAVEAVFKAKGRAARHPLPVMVDDLAVMKRLLVWSDVAEALALRFLPGPLTIVAPLAGKLPVGLTGGGATLGVRLSAHPVARLLCAAASGPLTATSANRSGGGEPYDPAAAFRSLAAGEELVEVVLDQGTLPASLVSTIVDLSGGIRIVRESAIARQAIRDCLASAGLSGAAELLALANNAHKSRATEERR